MLAYLLTILLGLAVQDAQKTDSGSKIFETSCAVCHGADGNGGDIGPAIGERLTAYDNQKLTNLIHEGLPARGMPPSRIAGPELAALLIFLRAIEHRAAARANIGRRLKLHTAEGKTLEGNVLGEGFDDVQLRTSDHHVHLLRRVGNEDKVREVTSETDWPTYNGDPRGNRYTTLTQINKGNITRLSMQWMFTLAEVATLEVTPVVVQGMMYVTAPNECFALDAGSGREIWHYRWPRTPAMTVGGGANRGVSIAGDRLFMQTPNAHIIALNRNSGESLWDAELADWRKNYFGSSAPLPAGNLIISGIAGGEHGANGFVAAHDQETGKEIWRFSTIPRVGEPGAKTWQGASVEHGGAPTWFTGSYDRDLDLVYWPTGNPSREYNGDDRKGDNLYSDCILALDRKTGRLRWYYQFTPHDVWDWDATQTSVLVDTTWQGQARKLMLHADRNGFFYVLDRRDGTLLLATPFVKYLTWASGISRDGRPIKLPNQEPTPQGTKVCPSQDGATNWFSPSFSPTTGLYYVQTFEKCSIYTKNDSDSDKWQPGKSFLGGSQRTAPDPTPQRVLKAIDIRNGAITWALAQPGPANSWGGTLATASGLVIFGEEGGGLMVVDAETGKPLWNFQTHHTWRASPMTYMFDGRQFVAVAAGPNIMVFAVSGELK
jgi:alcohol dehydrogenase (cytochrome c)